MHFNFCSSVIADRYYYRYNYNYNDDIDGYSLSYWKESSRKEKELTSHCRNYSNRGNSFRAWNWSTCEACSAPRTCSLWKHYLWTPDHSLQTIAALIITTTIMINNNYSTTIIKIAIKLNYIHNKWTIRIVITINYNNNNILMTNNGKIMNKYSKYLFIKTFSRFWDYLVEKFLRLFQHSQSEETGGQVRETAATIRIGIDTKQLFHILQHNACKKELIIKKRFLFFWKFGLKPFVSGIAI